jgi:hypothetical protein
MHTSAVFAEDTSRNMDPIEKKGLDLIRRFNDPDHKHVLRGIFKDTEGLDEIIEKQRQATTKINCVFGELVALKTVLNYLKAHGRS